ncbi:hypothetical protein WKW77_24595 [Variovorax ureilyticus]|uniref:Uncharacterized protein n=1 Tax=Variovorax ureilyticus TaxID=1836198 RepID=A0ABU8VLC1_9BURK
MLLRTYPCQGVLCLAESDEDRLTQLAAVLAVGSMAIWPANSAVMLVAQLPDAVSQWIRLVDDWTIANFNAVLHHGGEDGFRQVQDKISERGTPMIGLQTIRPGSADIRLDVLVVERPSDVEYARDWKFV